MSARVWRAREETRVEMPNGLGQIAAGKAKNRGDDPELRLSAARHTASSLCSRLGWIQGTIWERRWRVQGRLFSCTETHPGFVRESRGARLGRNGHGKRIGGGIKKGMVKEKNKQNKNGISRIIKLRENRGGGKRAKKKRKRNPI